MINKHWVEEVKENEGSDSVTITLSEANHGACIDIHGSREKATEKMVKILVILNDIKIEK